MTPGRRQWLAALALGAWAGVPAIAQPSPRERVARSGPAPLDWARYDGRVVLLDFWASWCAPCRLSFPWMERMHQRHAREGLAIVAVNMDTDPEKARRFLAAQTVSFDVVAEPGGRYGAALGARILPWSLLLAADGKVLATHAGFLPQHIEGREAAIRQALAPGRRTRG
jgi:thiol-disulfide isomerase/thioredoxin